jgi:threonine dehydratase
VKQRLFFYRVDRLADGAAVHQSKENSFAIFPDLADSPMAVVYDAAVRTQAAAYPVIRHFVVKHRLMHR